MTKEEFEKKFKIGDEIDHYQNVGVIKYIGKEWFMMEADDYDIHVYRHEECDITKIKKVEPVKKYWKHVFHYTNSPDVQVQILSSCELSTNATYLKEPTEITLDEI